MKRNIGYLDEALIDLKEAQNWYKSINVNLDKRFSRLVGQTIKRIIENPLLFPEKYGQIRVAVMNKFPYTVQYLIEKETNRIIIVAIFHDKRNPQSVLDRLN
jgi:plasmid stabilization system protein ParE